MKNFFLFILLIVWQFSKAQSNDSNLVETNGFFIQTEIESWIFIPTVKNVKCLDSIKPNMLEKGFKILYITDSLENKIFEKSNQYRNLIFPNDIAENYKYVRVTFAKIKYECILEKKQYNNAESKKVHKYSLKTDKSIFALKYDLTKNKIIEIKIEECVSK